MSATTRTAGCFTDPLGGLPDGSWDEAAGDRFYSTALWLRLCALAPGSLAGGLHVDLPGGGRAAVPVAAIRDEPNPNARWHEALAARGLPSPAPHGILVGARRGYLTHLLATAGADRAAAAEALLHAVRRIRDPQAPAGGAPAHVAMYLTTEDVLAFRAAGAGALPVALNTDASIAVPPGGWDAWLDSLSASRRSMVRREVRRFDRAGYRVERHTLLAAHSEVARLLARTNARYGRTTELAALTRSFAEQGELAGSRGQVLLCSRDGEPPVGFCLYYRMGDTVYLRAVGFDYERLRSAAEYFNLAFHHLLRQPGTRRLHLGISAQEGKALRGASLSPLWLLDLSESSALAGHEDEIRRHNRSYVAGLRALSPAVEAALPTGPWEVFC